MKSAYRYSCGVNLLVSFLGFALAMLMPRTIVSLFTNSEQMIELSASALRTALIGLSLVGFQVTTTQFFQSIGFSHKAIFLSLTRQIIFLIPCLLIIPRFMGLDGVWWSLPISDLASVVLSFVLITIQMKHFNQSKKTTFAE